MLLIGLNHNVEYLASTKLFLIMRMNPRRDKQTELHTMFLWAEFSPKTKRMAFKISQV